MFKFFQREQSIINNKQSIASGFTLIELLVVFSLISIVTGLGFASFREYHENQIVTAAAHEFKQAIDSAKFNAISVVKPTSSCPSGDSLKGYKVAICDNNPSPACQDPGSGKYELVLICGGGDGDVISYKTLPKGVSFENIAGQTDCEIISFDAITGATTGTIPCAINIKGYRKEIRIDVDSRGNVSFQN